MDSVGGPDAKKARWSPTSLNAQNGLSPGNTPTARDVFANYGYGPQAPISQQNFNNSPPSAGFSTPLYSTASLGMNGNHSPNGGMAQLSSNTAAVFAQQQQMGMAQQGQGQGQQNGMNGNGNVNGNAYGAGFGYNMLGMGLPGMNMLGGFPYTAQMGNFGQVGLISYPHPHLYLIDQVYPPAEFQSATSPISQC